MTRTTMTMAVCMAAATTTACFPITNTYQTARLLEPGQVETTVGVALTGGDDEAYNAETYTDEINTLYEYQVTAQVNVGVSEGVEVRGLVGYQSYKSIPLAAAVKISLIEDHLAFDLPVGVALGAGDPVGYLSVHPALIGTYRFSPYVEASGSVRTSAYLKFIQGSRKRLVTTGTFGLGPVSYTHLRAHET